MNDLTSACVALQTEMDAALELLHTAGAEMGDPLGGLLRARLTSNQPRVYSAVVLTAGFTDPAEPRAIAPRIPLAAALEMLAVALDTHQDLIKAGTLTGDQGPGMAPPNRTFIGGAILTGDYCFSRAAQLAARTESPRVVSIFAQTLQEISEGQLRYLFGAEANPFDERRALVTSGARAALELTTLSAAAKAAAITAASSLVLADSPGEAWPALAGSLDRDLTTEQRFRWQALAAWLRAGRASSMSLSPSTR
jgi:hypothetical protein